MNIRSSLEVVVTAIAGTLSLGCMSLAQADEQGRDADQYNHVLKRTNIVNDGEVDLLIREILFAPGWLAPRHFHNADLFIYVIEGEFEVTMENEDAIIYSAGQALEMRARKVMDARNPSDTRSLKLAVFQVGAPDSPFVVPIEQRD